MKKVYNTPAMEVAIVGMVTNLCAVSERPSLSISQSTQGDEPAY